MTSNANEPPYPPEHFQCSLSETLDERGDTYGDFSTMSHAINDLQRMIGKHQTRECHLNDVQYHALGMIMVKIGRILTGDPNYADSWHDIAGYATLVVEKINDSRKNLD